MQITPVLTYDELQHRHVVKLNRQELSAHCSWNTIIDSLGTSEKHDINTIRNTSDITLDRLPTYIFYTMVRCWIFFCYSVRIVQIKPDGWPLLYDSPISQASIFFTKSSAVNFNYTSTKNIIEAYFYLF